jgi:hypothetical protein
MCIKCTLNPGHAAHTFLCSPKRSSTFDLVALFVRANNLHQDCPPTLFKALAASHPNQEVWLNSFYEESVEFKVLTHTRKLHLVSIAHYARKGLLKLS